MRSNENSCAIDFPWGHHDVLPVVLPGTWDVSSEWPDLSGAVEDYPTALTKALDAPEGMPRIEALAGPGKTVAIVVDDPSRWTPVRAALPLILARLASAGVSPRDVSVSFGVGRHHAVDDAAMRERVGSNVVDTYACFSPPVDDLSRYDDLGTTPEGVPVRVFRPVAQADLRILIGSVLPHLQAGFGGGYKLIFPGCSHRSTLGALHRQGLDGDTKRLLGGDPNANPMRMAIRSAARLLPGPCVSISHLLGDRDQVFRVLSGDVDAVQNRLSYEAQSRFRASSAEPADVVVAGNHPWPGDPMMSFKVLINHLAAGKPGSLLIGMFWTDPDEIARSFPIGALKAISATGRFGGWVTRRGLKTADAVASRMESTSAFMIRWARELVVDRTVMVYAPPLRKTLGARLGPIRLFADQDAMWKVAEAEMKGVVQPKARVFPRGGLTYCPPAK